MAIPITIFYGIGLSGLSVNPLSGFTLATPFSASLFIQPEGKGYTQAAIAAEYNFIWWFGDGTQSTDYAPVHTYTWPGVYEVKVGIFNNTTGVTPKTYSVTVTASNFVNDKISWDYSQWPDLSAGQPTNGACFYGYQSCYSGTTATGPLPLTINYTTSILETSAVNFNLYSQNSLSQPYTEIAHSQISNLRPSWRFIDPPSNSVITNIVPTSSVPIIIDSNGNYNPNGTLVGLSGSNSFYYIDDIPSMVVHNYSNTNVLSANPTTLWVTLNTSNINNVPGPDYIKVPSYSNSSVTLSSYYYVQGFNPDHTNITVNGSLPFNSIYWPKVESRFTVTINSASASSSFLSNVNLLNYPQDIGAFNTFNITLSTAGNLTPNIIFNKSTNPTNPVLNYQFKRYDNLGRDTGGFYLGTFTPYTTGTNLLITNTFNSNFYYVSDLLPSPTTGYNPLTIPIPNYITVKQITSSTINSLGTYGMQGESNIFKTLDFNSKYFARKFGGGFDMGSQLKSYSLQPTINQNTVLFDDYLSSIAGVSATNEDTLGGVIFEKIANFVSNIADPDSANVYRFYSLADSLGITLDNYNFDIPPALSRVVDLYSTQQSTVWGSRSFFSRNFSLTAGNVNLGNTLTEYDISTTKVSAGQLIVVNDLFNSQNYELLEVPPITSYDSITARNLQSYFASGNTLTFPLTSYPLSGFFGWGLHTPVQSNYRFFVYNNTVDKQQVEGLVNWNDPYTTLSENASAHADWVKDGGTLETIFNYYIHKGLGLTN